MQQLISAQTRVCYSRRVIRPDVRVRCLFIAVTLLVCGIVSPTLAAQKKKFEPPHIPQYQVLPLERSSQNKLRLRVLINNKPALLEVDTGAPISAIAATRAQYFGLLPVGANSDLPMKVDINGASSRVAVAQTFQIGFLTLVDEPLVALDL